MVGKTLGHYEILEPLGKGGRGEVYRARDTKLKREVAIKMLPEELSADPDRLARLEREAHLLAALNHANIATIYALEEEEEGTRFLVLELVRGESLEQQLSRGPLPVEKALDVCMQIAEALEAAHAEGIIHRDLKPGNILVTPEGNAKVLDFGLAKPTATTGVGSEADMSHSPTVTVLGTQTGVILGTAPYMSPEQVRGQPLDKRADIWAFGCVLYEALVGRRAFDRETVADTLAAIIEVEPAWGALPEATPAMVQSLVRRCLRKDPNRRLHDIADARIEIEEVLAEPWKPSPAPEIERRLSWRVSVPIAAAAAILAGLAVWVVMRSDSQVPEALTRRLAIALPPGTNFMRGVRGVALSVDGRNLVFLAEQGGVRQLYLRRMDQLVSTPIPGTEGANMPFFTSAGQSVGFVQGGDLKKVSLAGGDPLNLCEGCVDWGTDAAWDPVNDIIVFETEHSFWQISAAGGDPVLLAEPDPERGEVEYDTPDILPGGKAILFEIVHSAAAAESLAVLDLRTNEVETLIEGSHPHYVDTGHVIYTRGDSVFAVPFDLEQLRVTGDPTPILQEVGVTAGGNYQFSVSRDGSLAYASDPAVRRSLVWVDREGNDSTLDERQENFQAARLSPDGKKIAVAIFFADRAAEIWIYGIDDDTWQKLTNEGHNSAPLWTTDGSRVLFTSSAWPTRTVDRWDIYWKPWDFSSDRELLLDTDGALYPMSWTIDGQELILHEFISQDERKIFILPLDGDGTAHRFTNESGLFDERSGMMSLDGKWLAYVSDYSGRDEVYVRSFPDLGGRRQVSNEGGTEPRWGSDGELFYRNGPQMIVATVETDPEFTVLNREVIFSDDAFLLHASGARTMYDYDPRTQRFLMARQEASASPTITVVLNFDEELKRLVPTGGR